MTETGVVTLVVKRDIGTTLMAPHAAGATVLQVKDRAEFDEAGGTLTIDGHAYAYDAWDGDAEEDDLVITPGLLEDAIDGAKVLVDPPAADYIATVLLDDGESGAQEAYLEHDQIELLEVGPRDPGTEEPVTLENGPAGWRIVNIDRETPTRDGSFIRPETLPAPDPVDPWGPAPDDAPVLAAVPFAIGAVRGAWGPVERAQTYEVFASLTPGIDVETATPVGSISGTRFDIASLDGVLLPMGEAEAPVFMRVRAVNPNGAGPASNEASATARQADNEFISALYAYFGAIEVNQLTSGTLDAVVAILGSLLVGDGMIAIDPPSLDSNGKPVGGIVIKDPANLDGEPLVRLHPAGCTFRGRIVTDVLTVLQDMQVILSAQMMSGSTTTLKNGIADPTAKATLNSGPSTAAVLPAPPSGYTHKGLAWDAARSQYIELLLRDSDKAPRVRAVSTAGVAGSIRVVDTPSVGIGAANRDAVAPVVDGDFLFWVYRSYESGYGAYDTLVKSSVLGTGALSVSASAQIYDAPSAATVGGRPALAVYGGNVHVAWSPSPSVQAAGTRINRYSVASLDYVNGEWGLPSIPGGTILRGLYVGAADFGSLRVVVSLADETRVHPYPASPNLEAPLAAASTPESWPMVAVVDAFYKSSGDNPGFHTVAGQTIQSWTSYYPSSDGTWAARYVNKNGSATTKASPISDTIVVGKRHAVTISLPVAPEGITAADVYLGYANGVTPATFYKRSETVVDRRATVRTKDQTGTTTLPAANTLGGNPAILQSEVGGFLVTGAGYVKALGLLQPHTKRDSSGTQQSPTSGSITKITTWGSVVDASTKIDNGVDDDIAYSAGDFTVRLAGLYLLAVGIRFTGNATGIRAAYIYKNGTTLLRVEQSGAVTGSAYDASATAIVRLAAGDVVHFSGLQNSGGALAVVATGTTASITRLAA